MVTPGNVEAGGAVAVVESMEETVTMTWGKAQVISGVAIFNISSIAPGTVNRLRIHIILTNPYDMSKVFGNPHAYINVTVSDSHNTTGNVYAWDILYRERAEVLLTPRDAPTGTTTLYIQVSVMVPGGPPPGIQEKTGLVYYCKVELA
ncbi:MAG: hypothetical protein FJ045_02905 [Crenarchaeota archaeon]|nr:hypothetical protein [Thermoproteota archaeon]